MKTQGEGKAVWISLSSLTSSIPPQADSFAVRRSVETRSFEPASLKAKLLTCTGQASGVKSRHQRPRALTGRLARVECLGAAKVVSLWSSSVPSCNFPAQTLLRRASIQTWCPNQENNAYYTVRGSLCGSSLPGGRHPSKGTSCCSGMNYRNAGLGNARESPKRRCEACSCNQRSSLTEKKNVSGSSI